MDAGLRALADPTRREILRLVHDGELTAGQIAGEFDVTRPAISQHLRVLHDADLVTVRRDGTRRYYQARPDTIAGLIRGIESMWDDGLAQLKLASERDDWPTRAKQANA
jgi:DNA-binding transcriptional ArsR family regulator